jgi:hypothetical protein
MLHISSTEDLALKNFLMSTQRQGDTAASSNATNYYTMGMPGSSAEAAAVSSQENLHHAISHSGDNYVGLSSVRKASPPTVAEGGNWIGEQTTVEMMGAVDSGHHHVSHERVSQSVLWPPPFIQVPSQFIHAGHTQIALLSVSSAMSLPATSLCLGVQAAQPNLSLGDSSVLGTN